MCTCKNDVDRGPAPRGLFFEFGVNLGCIWDPVKICLNSDYVFERFLNTVDDWSMFDEDGLPIADETGDTLVPLEPERTYEEEEEEAVFLNAFAGTYREVRGQLQAACVLAEIKSYSTNSQSTKSIRDNGRQ